MRRLVGDRRASYGAFILLAAFAACVVTVGYFISASDIYSSAKGEAVGHITTYQGISRQDLLRIVEEAALVASREAGAKGWDEREAEERFKEMAEVWINSYLAERGVYGVDIMVEEKSEMKEKGGETYIDLGRYVIAVFGAGAKAEIVVD
jgi:hypothetical protein